MMKAGFATCVAKPAFIIRELARLSRRIGRYHIGSPFIDKMLKQMYYW